MASNSLDVTDWRVLPCEHCEQITKIVRGTCERCGRDLWEAGREVSDSGGGRDE